MDRNKLNRALTFAVFAMICSALLFVLIEVDTPSITGNAVHELVDEKGVSTAVMFILLFAVLFGMVTYGSVSALNVAEQYAKNSKYWAGFAMQRMKWKKKEKKEKDAVTVEMAGKDVEEAAMHDDIPEELPELEAKPVEGDVVPEEDTLAGDGSEDMTEEESPEEDAGKEEAAQEDAQTDGEIGVEEVSSIPEPEVQEEKDPESDIKSMFGTTDALKVAEMILKRGKR
ncbi:hypothetical protein ACFL3V_03550 [Nanoarchaeota archaeon]